MRNHIGLLMVAQLLIGCSSRPNIRVLEFSYENQLKWEDNADDVFQCKCGRTIYCFDEEKDSWLTESMIIAASFLGFAYGAWFLASCEAE